MILAGGSGTRLWPASRQTQPKQFLTLGGDEPLVAAAAHAGRAIADERVVIVTAEAQVDATRAALPGIDLIAEPMGRNTAAAIGLAAAILERRDPAAMLAVLPADQHVRDRAGFARALDTALAAAEHSDAIATIGIPPTRAEIGFGYLEVAGPAALGAAVPVVRFVEKPDRPTAERYVASGRFLWNAGIFCASAKRLLAELDAQLPDTAQAVRAMAADPSAARERYAKLVSISIDHAVMEHATNVVTVPAAIGWDDVGSWAALPAMRDRNSDGNTVAGQTLVIGGTNNIVMSDADTLIATVGVSDLVVIKSGDAILVIPRDQAQDVRKVVEALATPALSRFR